MTNQPIPTFIVSSEIKPNKENVLNAFSGKNEFDLHFTKPYDISDTNGLWQIIQHITLVASDRDYDYFLLCNSDHQFTEHYSKENLLSCINEAERLGSNLLLGDVQSFSSAIRVSKGIFWVENFEGSSFMIIFRSFFREILADNHKVFTLSSCKFFIYPFVSYSSNPERSDTEFNKAEIKIKSNNHEVSQQVELLDYISKFYEDLSDDSECNQIIESLDKVVIPTFIINLSERTERLKHIKLQFENRNEFDVQIIEATKHPKGTVGLWKTIRKIVKKAIDNEDDIIIICEDDHEFTSDYSKSYMLENIIQAYFQQTEMLLGGICGLKRALPISNNRVWVNYSHCLQFTILYRPVFQKILDEPYNDDVIPDILLSDLVANKMVLYPFISTQKYFGYSDVSQGNNDDKEMVVRNFAWASNELKKIYKAKNDFVNKGV